VTDATTESGKKRTWFRYFPAALIAVCGLTISIVAFLHVRNSEYRTAETEFLQESENHITALRREIELNTLIVESTGSFCANSTHVDPEAFSAFVKLLHGRETNLHALEWVPRVDAAERTNYEIEGRKRWGPRFEITENAGQGLMRRAAERTQYFPVTLVEPRQNNTVIAGFDLASDESRRKAMETACDTGWISATPQVPLFQENNSDVGFLLLQPVYRKGMPVDTVEDRRKALQGFAVGVVHIMDALEKALSYLQPFDLDIRIDDLSASEEQHVICLHRSSNAETLLTVCAEFEHPAPEDLHYAGGVQIADRHWWVTCTPPSGYFANARSWYPWYAMSTVSFLTVVMIIYILAVLSHGEKTREFATKMLKAKQRLETEAAERWAAQEALRKSEARYSQLVEQAPDPLVFATLEGKIVSANRATERVFGYRLEEILGKHFDKLDMVTSETLPRLQEEFAKAMQGQDCPPVEFGIRCKDGTINTVEGHLRLVRDGEQASGVQCIVRNITERRRAEEEAHHLRQQLEFILGATNTGLDIIDSQFNLRYVDPAWAKTYGDWKGRKCYEYFMGRSDTCPNCGIIKALETKEVTITEELLAKEGDRPVQVTTIPFRDDTGEWLVAEVNVDIAERHRTENRLRRVNQLQTELLKPEGLDQKLKRITDGLVDIVDADFARIWLTQIGDLCDAGCVHAGVTEGPHVCRYRDQCLALRASSGRYTQTDGSHSRVPFGCYKIGHVASGEDRRFLTNDVTHDPRIHNHQWAAELGLVSFAGYQIRPPGEKTIGVLALFAKHPLTPAEDALLESLANLTAQVVRRAQAEEREELAKKQIEQRAEEFQRLNRKLNRAIREKNEFLRAVSHDLSAPLRNVAGMATFLKSRYAEKLDETGLDRLERILKNIKAQSDLINDLLELSRIKTRRGRLEPTDLNQVLHNVTEQFAFDLDKKSGMVEVVGTFPVLWCESNRMSQVFQNLIDNAIKYAHPDRPCRVAIGINETLNHYVITVADNGIGMSSEDAERAFFVFQRAHNAYTAQVEGKGVGLASVKSILENYGGEISVESEEGRGSTFTITLPKAMKDQPIPESEGIGVEEKTETLTDQPASAGASRSDQSTGE